MSRRLALAQALLGSPAFLVLDEPTAGLDPEQRFRFRELGVGARRGRTVLLSTHQTEDVAAIVPGSSCSTVAGAFDGDPSGLAVVAAGRVWVTAATGRGARLAWRTADGDVPPGRRPPGNARLVEPTIEDGYLLLAGAAALEEEPEAA